MSYLFFFFCMWCTTGAFCCLATRSALTLMWKLGPIPFHRMSTSVPVCDFSSLSLSLMQPAADDTFWHFELGGSFLPSESIRFEASQWQSTVAQVVGVFLTSFCQKCEQRTFFCCFFLGPFKDQTPVWYILPFSFLFENSKLAEIYWNVEQLELCMQRFLRFLCWIKI